MTQQFGVRRPARPGSPAGVTAQSVRQPYAAGLDGIRAIAVVCVVLYHAGVPGLRGGFVGVDLFFVVSGYLVTALLQREHDRIGRIRLSAFFRRRARRLLPALLFMLTVVCAATLTLGHDLGAGLRSQLLGAGGFASNWVQISSGQSYIDHAEPAVLTHLWSLAVEEQFYLLWPIVCLLLLTRLRLRHRRVASVLLLAAVSAALMALLFQPGSDPTRVYVGTDTHGFGLLLGAALAFARPSSGVDPVARFRPPTPTGAAALLGPFALLLVLAAAVGLSDAATSTFRGGLLLTNVAATVLVAATVRGTGPVALLLAHPTFRWLGLRSYALYLWHWPALVIADRVVAPTTGRPAAAVIAIGIALLASEVSWRCVEQPVRRLGVVGYLRTINRTLLGRPVPAQRRSAGWAAAGAFTLVLGLAACSVVAAPRETELAVSLAAGEQALAAASAARSIQPAVRPAAPPMSASTVPGITSAPAVTAPAVGTPAAPTSIPTSVPSRPATTATPPVPQTGPTTPGTSSSSARPGGPGSGVVLRSSRGRPGAAATRPDPTPSSAAKPPRPVPPRAAPSSRPPVLSAPPTQRLVSGADVGAIGDSVMLAAAPALLERFPDADIDAVVSRQLWDLPALVAARVNGGLLRPDLVIGLGTNGTDSVSHIQSALAQLPASEVVVLVNSFVPDSWQDDVNAHLAAVAAARPHTCVADWHAAIGARQDLLGPDGVHPGAPGGELYAAVVGRALQACR